MNRLPFNLWNSDDFEQAQYVLDNQMQALTKAGLGQTVKHAQPFSFKDELLLWQWVFDLETPLGLIR